MSDIQCFKYMMLPKQGNCMIKTLVQQLGYGLGALGFESL